MGQVDTLFLNPFLQGTLEALKVTCGIEVQAGKPFIKGSAAQPEFHIGAVLGVVSTTFSGSLTLMFPKSVYMAVVSAWLGEEITELNNDHMDGVAELLNIIYGSAKVVWNEQGRNILKAIPTVLQGNPLHTQSKLPVLVVPFMTKAGVFNVEICQQPAGT